MHQKLRWIRQLFRQGFSREEIMNLIRALEAMNPLPRHLAVEFRNRVVQSDPEKAMPIVTCFELLAREEALAEGLSQGLSRGQTLTLRDSIRDLIQERFGHTPPDIGERLEQETDTHTLKSWLRRSATVDSVEAFRAFLEHGA